MFYSFSGTIVVSYLGGTFGNSLDTLINASLTGKIKQPRGDTFHVNDWPIEPIDCTITKNDPIRFRKKIESDDIIQLHCLNAELIAYKFPVSRCIMLDCQSGDEYFGIQRQWLVNTTPIDTSINNILSAWNWIEYNLNYYNKTSKINQGHGVLCLDFKSVIKNFKSIEDYLGVGFLQEPKEIYILHYQKQMQKFYIKNTNFDFAWTVFNDRGPTAPINDLAREFLS